MQFEYSYLDGRYLVDLGENKFILTWQDKNFPVTGCCVVRKHYNPGYLFLKSNIHVNGSIEIHEFITGGTDITECVATFNDQLKKQIQQLYEPGGQKYLQSQEKISNLS